ncbi:hypothetical protein Taro_037924, partial [Colocasia esculenta]|nr:hypothetical protein [Colocasia esculenta]
NFMLKVILYLLSVSSVLPIKTVCIFNRYHSCANPRSWYAARITLSSWGHLIIANTLSISCIQCSAISGLGPPEYVEGCNLKNRSTSTVVSSPIAGLAGTAGCIGTTEGTSTLDGGGTGATDTASSGSGGTTSAGYTGGC